MTLKPIPQPPAPSEASALYDRAIKGETAAVTELGQAYYFGMKGVAHNERAAFHLFQRAVEDGDAGAMWLLGRMYAGGYAFPPQDFAMARRLFEMAAERGHRGGWLSLADFCFRGVAGPTDLARSRQLYELAANSGCTDGMERLAHLLDRGMGGPPDYERAAQWHLRAALESHAPAQHQLLSKWTSLWNTEMRKAIQRRLREAGHYRGSIDGAFGEKTHAALRAFVGPIKPLVSKEILEALSRMDRRKKQKLP